MSHLWHIVGVIGALIVAVAIHEAAHSIALAGLGFRTGAAGIGLPMPPMLTVTSRRGFRFTVSPWLLAAYVEVDKRDRGRVAKLPYRDHAWYLNAGLVANLMLCAAMWAFAAPTALATAVCGVAFVVVFVFRRFIAAVVLPALAVPALVAVVWSLVPSWRAGDSGLGFHNAPDVAPHLHTWREWLVLVGGMSLTVAVLNMVPIYPLDNAKVCDRLVTRFGGRTAARWYRLTGTVVVVAILAGSVVSDLLVWLL